MTRIKCTLALSALGAIACGNSTGPDDDCEVFFRESVYTAALVEPGGSTQVGLVQFSTYETREGPSLEESTLRRATVRWQVLGGGVNAQVIHVHGPAGSDSPVLYLGIGLISFFDGLPYVVYQEQLPFETLHATLQAQTAVFDVHGPTGPPVSRGIITRLAGPLTGPACGASD